MCYIITINMTPFYLFKKVTPQKLVTMNALALVVFVLFFLTSTLVHADHIASHGTNAEQQECYICHQGLDTPSGLLQPKVSSITSYFHCSYAIITTHFRGSYFVQPQLRAPPIF